MALTNHPTDEILRVTLDASDEGSNNEDDAQLNTKTDNDHPTTRPTDHSTKAEMMEITPDHPVYVEGKGWVWAENLVVGDRLRRSDGGWAKVLAVERVKLAEPEPVYNFTVKGPHTYFVLEVGVLVHNDSCPIARPGKAVSIEEASEKSGIPERYLEPVQEISYNRQTICAFRDCNPYLDRLATGSWPKDTDAPVYGLIGEKLKVSSAASPRFKTNKYGLVQVQLEVGGNLVNYGVVRRPGGIFELMPMDKIINSRGDIILPFKKGIPMGPDIDSYFFLQKTDWGVINLGSDTRISNRFPYGGELDIRGDLATVMSDRRQISSGQSMSVTAVGHGPAQPYFGYVLRPDPPPYHPKSWGPALVVDEDQFIWLADHEIETFFNYYGLTTRQKGPFGKRFVSNDVVDYP